MLDAAREQSATVHTNPVVLRFSNVPPGRRRSAIFLDRDGVINERIVGGYVTHWSEFRFLEGSIAALRELSRFRLPLIVVSNQAGIGNRLMTRAALADITRRFVALLGRSGIRIAAVCYCPHTSDAGCPCRKPRPGLLLQAARDWRIELGRSILIGDSPSDIEAAHAAGCGSILFDPRDEFPSYSSPASKLVLPGSIRVRKVSDLPSQAATLLGRYLPTFI